MKKSITFVAFILLVIGQTAIGQSAFINEINYTASNPSQRGVELAGEAGSNLDGYSVVVYSIAGSVENVENIAGSIIPNQQNGYGAIWYDVDQNSNGGGIALVNPNGDVLQFLSYGMANFVPVIVTATEGAAEGLTSEYVGTQLLPLNSLQLTGLGFGYADFLWNLPTGITEGTINNNQVFGNQQSLAGNSNPPAVAAAEIVQLADNESNSPRLNFLVFPNPTVDFVQVKLAEPMAETGALRVFGADGQLLQNLAIAGFASTATADLSSLPAGRYIVQVNLGQASRAVSVIKI